MRHLILSLIHIFGFQGGNKHDTELNQWINHEKEVLAEIAKQHGIEWEQKGTHEEHLDVYNFKKKERKKEVQELEQEKEYLTAENEGLTSQIADARADIKLLEEEKIQFQKDKETAEKRAGKAEMELKKLEDRREFLQPVMDNVSKEIKEYGDVYKRQGRNWIIMGMILFTICLGIYKMPFYWTLPFLQQEEIRYMLLLGSIFAVFRLTLRSMVQQLDSILEKATDGLFIPISENRIVKQFMVIPITIVCGEGIIMAFVVNSSIAQILLGCAILICATVLNLWLEVKYKNFLVKKDFILSIAVFLGALILTK